MPVYKKLGKRVSWYAIFYYTDWTGKKHQKKKEGFRTQREAKQYEHDFLERLAGSPSMTMNTLADIYLENLKTRVKQSSYSHNMQIIGKHIRPYFGEMPVNTISPAAIRKWQEGFNGKGYCNYYLHIIQAQLSTLFNFAMKYYGLPNNPAQQAGNCWKAKASREMKFLTIEDFGKLREALLADNQYMYYAAFSFLFLTGCRRGEMLALTAADIDLVGATVTINKTYNRINKKDVITTPKTDKSNRTITLPSTLVDIMKQYMAGLGEIKPQQRIFEGIHLRMLKTHLDTYTAKAGLPRIRVHDLRHSHASLLIEQKIPALAIADRLGHESVKTTLDIYSHLYPNKRKEVAEKIDNALNF